MLRVERRPAGQYAVVWLAREPVNAMSLQMWRELRAVLRQLEADPQVRGVIFCSALRRDVFTAGQDLRELYAPLTTQERTTELWRAMNGFLLSLYTSPLVTVAAIRGACPAGGCLLALCCDYRVMTDIGSIGLNEVAISIPLPRMFSGLLARVVGIGPADRLAQLGIMLRPAEAQRVGLVDEVVPKERLQASAEAAVQRMLAVPDHSRTETKRLLRSDYAQQWATEVEPEAAAMWTRISSPQTVAHLAGVLGRLSSPRHKAAPQQEQEKNQRKKAQQHQEPQQRSRI